MLKKGKVVMDTKKLIKVVLNILIIVFFLATSFCLFSVIKLRFDTVKDTVLLDDFVISKAEVKQLVSDEDKRVNQSQSSLSNTVYNPLDYYRKKYNNEEVVGLLSVNNTKINTVLMQTSDNGYYLRRLPNKKNHVTGSVFIDYRTKLNNDKNVIIYGHNANNYDIPFRYLRNYLNEKFYLDHKDIDVITDDKKLRYEIFSVYVTEKTDEFHTKVYFNSDEAWLNHLNGLKAKSIYGTNVSLKANDSIITLQTCLLKDDALIVISAKKI